MLVLKFHTSLVLQCLLHALSASPGMKKVMNGPQGPLFAIVLSKCHVGLLDRKFAHERAWYAFWSSFFPHSMKMFRLSLFPFSGSHIVILGIACLHRLTKLRLSLSECKGAISARLTKQSDYSAWQDSSTLVFLYHLCTLYVSQSDFLRSCTTGNIQKFPPWYKSLGWYEYGFLPSSVADKACGGLSSICGRVVAGFFGGQTSLTRGIVLPGRDGNFAFNDALGRMGCRPCERIWLSRAAQVSGCRH